VGSRVPTGGPVIGRPTSGYLLWKFGDTQVGHVTTPKADDDNDEDGDDGY